MTYLKSDGETWWLDYLSEGTTAALHQSLNNLKQARELATLVAPCGTRSKTIKKNCIL